MTDVMQSRCKLASLSYRVADEMIESIEHLPGGTIFWRMLPRKGHHSSHTMRRRLATILVKAFFPPSFLTALLKASVDPIGQVDKRGAPLHKWLVEYIYHGDEAKFYTAWMRVRR